MTPVPVSGQVANPPVQPPPPVQPSPVPSTGPNANPLDLFPQVFDMHYAHQSLILFQLNLLLLPLIFLKSGYCWLPFRASPTQVQVLQVWELLIFYGTVNRFQTHFFFSFVIDSRRRILQLYNVLFIVVPSIESYGAG